MKEPSAAAPPAPTPPPGEGSKRNWKKTAAIAVGSVLVAGAGIGAFWWSQTATAQGGDGHESAAAEPAQSRGLIGFDPFVVNLSDGVGRRFLRTTLQLVIEPAETAAAIGENPVLMLQLRSALLELLAQQTAETLVTSDGKAAVKAAIISRAQTIATGGKVADVFFSEFVVQF